MRKVREEFSELYKTDKKRYFEEIKKAMADFQSRQTRFFSVNIMFLMKTFVIFTESNPNHLHPK